MRSAYFLMLIFAGVMMLSCTPDEMEDVSALSVNQVKVEVELENKTIELVNAFRASHGLGVLVFNEDAYNMAFAHTLNIALTGVMSHADFDNRARGLANKVGAVKVAENLSTNYDSAEETLEKWLESDGHHENIVGDFTHTAVAVLRTNNGDVYYTQVFFKKGD